MSSQTVPGLATRVATNIRELQCRKLWGAEDGMLRTSNEVIEDFRREIREYQRAKEIIITSYGIRHCRHLIAKSFYIAVISTGA